jgi:hypothetical protein
MRHLFLTRILFSALIASAQVVAQPSATAYPTHLEQNGVSIGARLLTADQVQHAIAYDLKHCCLILEVAVYPQRNKVLPISLDDFSLRVVGTDQVIKPASSRLVAAILTKKSEPPRDVSASGSVGIGYETASGRDPYGNKQSMSGVSKEAEIGVGVGGSGNAPPPPNSDRISLELELGGKSLPEGSTAVPVAGYLYFPLSAKKQKSKAAYQIEVTLDGQSLVLSLPRT